jgi:hypothetical protein
MSADSTEVAEEKVTDEPRMDRQIARNTSIDLAVDTHYQHPRGQVSRPTSELGA